MKNIEGALCSDFFAPLLAVYAVGGIWFEEIFRGKRGEGEQKISFFAFAKKNLRKRRDFCRFCRILRKSKFFSNEELTYKGN